jgi:hypothetical protein
MYLREDELGPEEWREFQRHRSTCAGCAAEHRKVEQTLNAVARLGDRIPNPPNPVVMANTVVGEIEHLKPRRASVRARSVYEIFVQWLGLPRVRVAIASVLTFICGSFAVEYTSGYLHIMGLENSMMTYSSSQTNASAQFLTQSDASDVVSDLSRFVIGKKSFFKVSGDWVMINKSSIENFILLYNDLQSVAPKLPPEFRATHPQLWQLMTKKKDPKELDALLKERMSLIRELNDLIPPERRSP